MMHAQDGEKIEVRFSATFTNKQLDEMLRYCNDHNIFRTTLIRKAVKFYMDRNK